MMRGIKGVCRREGEVAGAGLGDLGLGWGARATWGRGGGGIVPVGREKIYIIIQRSDRLPRSSPARPPCTRSSRVHGSPAANIGVPTRARPKPLFAQRSPLRPPGLGRHCAPRARAPPMCWPERHRREGPSPPLAHAKLRSARRKTVRRGRTPRLRRIRRHRSARHPKSFPCRRRSSGPGSGGRFGSSCAAPRRGSSPRRSLLRRPHGSQAAGEGTRPCFPRRRPPRIGRAFHRATSSPRRCARGLSSPETRDAPFAVTCAPAARLPA
jgi:hypothetical protein